MTISYFTNRRTNLPLDPNVPSTQEILLPTADRSNGVRQRKQLPLSGVGGWGGLAIGKGVGGGLVGPPVKDKAAPRLT